MRPSFHMLLGIQIQYNGGKQMIRMTGIAVTLIFMVAVCYAEDKIPLTDKKAKDSYSLGYEFGKNLKSHEVELNEKVLVDAIREALADKEPAMNIEAIQETLKQLRKEVLIRYNLQKNEVASKNKKDGEGFLAANKTRAGVNTLKSGLQYKVLTEGNGPNPLAADIVSVNYRGTLLNGMEFDSSYARGAQEMVKVDDMIPAWSEALQLMKAGSKWQLFVPAELAYGELDNGTIAPNSTLIYELELVSIEKDKDLDVSVSGTPAESVVINTETNVEESETVHREQTP